MDCILQWDEYFGSSLAKGIILGSGLALRTAAGSGFAEDEPEGHNTHVPRRGYAGGALG